MKVSMTTAKIGVTLANHCGARLVTVSGPDQRQVLCPCRARARTKDKGARTRPSARTPSESDSAAIRSGT